MEYNKWLMFDMNAGIITGQSDVFVCKNSEMKLFYHIRHNVAFPLDLQMFS